MSVRDQIDALVEKKRDKFISVADKVWSMPELGFKEEKSAAVIMEALEAEGFAVEKGLAGIPTAFKGVFGSGKPVIGFLGEYDALPNLSQEAGCAVKKEVEAGGNGHGCGHNSLGAGSLAAAVALKDYMQESGMSGTIEFYGCPGEEFGCGKAFMARDGVFDGLDCAFSWHPGDNNAPWVISSLANISVYFSFEGKTAHAAAAPHMGRSALDAAELMNVGVNFLREHVIPEARIHYAFHEVGGTAPNVVQDRAKLHYYIRAPKIEQAKEIFERIKDIAAGAALMTGTKSTIAIRDGLCDFVPNHVLTAIVGEAMNEIGSIPFDAEDEAIAQKFHDTLSEQEYKSGFRQIGMLGGPETVQKYTGKNLFDAVLPYQKVNYCMPASTDVGDVSYVTPTAQLTAVTGCIGTAAHTWQMTAQGATSISHKGMLFAGKSLALAAAKVLANPEVLEKAQAEYVQETGGKYNCPFPDDVKPAL